MKLALEINFDPTTESFRAKGLELRPAFGKSLEEAIGSLLTDEKNRLILRTRAIKEVITKQAPLAGQELQPFHRGESRSYNVDKAVLTGRPTRANIALGHISYLRMGLAGLTHSQIAEKMKLENRDARIAKLAWQKASRWAIANKRLPDILLPLENLAQLRAYPEEVTRVLNEYEAYLKKHQQNPLHYLKMVIQGTSFHELAKTENLPEDHVNNVTMKLWQRAVEYAKSTGVISTEFYGMERMVDIQSSVLIAMRVVDVYEKFIVAKQLEALVK